MRATPIRAFALVLCAGVLAGSWVSFAQGDPGAFTVAEPGAPGSPEELRVWGLVQGGRYIKAREAAEDLLERQPDSYLGHFILGCVFHYGEANFPWSLYHLDKALRLFEARHGSMPGPSGPWRWHARMLVELAAIHAELEHHEERLVFFARHNALYDPDIVAAQAWPLLKLGRYDDARRVAEAGVRSGDPVEVAIGLNALCAIGFEAGNEIEGYEACRAALEHARSSGRESESVDYTNFAEAARSVFKLDEAERVLLEGTRANSIGYGHPWLDLADLYIRGARFAEALDALREVPRLRSRREPHMRDSDRNESRRALASFFLVVGRPEEALRITEAALVMPDRRGHSSRDPAQDGVIVALLDRRARLTVAELQREKASALGVVDRLGAHWDAARLKVQAWMSGRRAARLLADDERLVGFFRIGGAQAAIVQPWIVGDLVEVLGAGVVFESIRRARERDRRPGADAYYDAFEAEASLAMGDETRAIELAQRARGALGDGEALLRARVDAIRAEAMRREEGVEASLAAYGAALQQDPGVFRRLGWSIPVRVNLDGDDVAEEVADGLARSPRFSVGDEGLEVRGDATAASARVCLRGPSGSVLGCGEATPTPSEPIELYAQHVLDDLHARVFAPRVDLTQADIGSLDGTNRVGRDPLVDLLPQPGEANPTPP